MLAGDNGVLLRSPFPSCGASTALDVLDDLESRFPRGPAPAFEFPLLQWVSYTPTMTLISLDRQSLTTLALLCFALYSNGACVQYHLGVAQHFLIRLRILASLCTTPRFSPSTSLLRVDIHTYSATFVCTCTVISR